MTAPTMFLCILILVLNCVVLRPEAPLQVERPFARAQLRGLGPIAPAELFTAFVVTASAVYWATDRWHHLPSFLAGMIGAALFALAGIVRDQELSVGVSWPLLLFLGGIFSLANVIQDQKIRDWIGQALAPSVAALTSNHLVALLVMTLAMFAVRFVDPTGFIALAVVFLPLADTMQQHGIPPLVFVAPLVLACVPFWASYQNNLGRDGRRHDWRSGVWTGASNSFGECLRDSGPANGRGGLRLLEDHWRALTRRLGVRRPTKP